MSAQVLHRRAAATCGRHSIRYSRASVVVRAEASTVSGSKSVLITGGNTGIGFETAKVLCAKGYDVTLACRDPARAAAAVSRIRAEQPGATVDSLTLDLANLASVRDAAARISDSDKPLDILLNNAGVMACPRMETADGFELQLGVNHLGHFLFTRLLLPKMLNSARPGRIINVASTAHLFGAVNFDDLQSERDYDRWRAYGQSKLANILFTYELSRRIASGALSGGSGNVTANCLHPGVVRTELPRYLMEDPDAPMSRLITALATPFTLSPEQGARTSIYLASSPDVEGVSGKYFDSCRPVSSNPASYDTTTAARLWDVSEELTAAARPPARMAAAAATAL